MGQQTRKVLKRRRRSAYLERKKEQAKLGSTGKKARAVKVASAEKKTAATKSVAAKKAAPAKKAAAKKAPAKKPEGE